MAIKINGTTVIDDSRNLVNIASGAGASFTETTVLNSSLATWDARNVAEAEFNYGYSFSGLPTSGTYATIKTFTQTGLASVFGELNTSSTSDSTFITGYSTTPGPSQYGGYQIAVYYYNYVQNTSTQVLSGAGNGGRASAFFTDASTSKTSAIRENIPRLNMALKLINNGDKILFSLPSANYWGGSFTLNANVIKFRITEVN